MTSRERVLLGILGLLGAAGAVFGGYLLVYKPLQEKRALAAQAAREAEDLEGKAADLAFKVRGRAAPAKPGDPSQLPLADARRRSLPANREQAARQYRDLLDYLARDVAKGAGIRVDAKEATDNRSVPVLPGGDRRTAVPAYGKVVFEVEIEKVDMWGVIDFLAAYYDLDLLHRITELTVRRQEAGVAGAAKAPAGRNDLQLRLVTEGLIVDGGGPKDRRPLLWVSPGFAAVGGMAGYDTVSVLRDKDYGRAPPPLARPRDAYALLAVKDVFHGELAAPFRLEKLAAVNKVVGDRIAPIPLEFAKPGPGVDVPPLNRLSVTATAGGKLLPPGSVKVQPRTTPAARPRGAAAPAGPPAGLELVVTPAKGETGAETIRVRAEARDGRVAETEVKVTVVGPSPLTVEGLKDIAVRPGEPVPPVKLAYKGDNALRGKITFAARADGRVLADGEEAKGVAVNPEDGTLTLTPVDGEVGTSTVTVVATAENGETAKAAFRFTVEPPPRSARPDIADAIRLVIVSVGADRTASAVIKDSFNPQTYELEAGPDGVRVKKYFYAGPTRKEDKLYREFAKLLYIADDEVSSTERKFRVLAVDGDGLLLLDLMPPTVRAAPVVGRAKTDPAAAVVGGGGAEALRLPPETVYRWTTGKPLSGLARLTPAEARAAIDRAAKYGPVGATVADATRP